LESLRSRIDDWKGHSVGNFGQLLLHDFFMVTRSDIDHKFWVFLFEKILVCVKGFTPEQKPQANKLAGFLKKKSTPTAPNSTDHPQRRNTPLLLKGRIFVGNVTQAVPVTRRGSSESPLGPGIPSDHPLAVWWKGDDDLEFIILRCQDEEQRCVWETQINEQIQTGARQRVAHR
ncbi:Pleckstrin homology domain-containing protein, partial [Mycena leptocephala]